MPEPCRKSVHREKIRKTVERIAPDINIDATKILSDEDMANIREQTEKRLDAQKLADECGRARLQELLRISSQRAMDISNGPTH